MLFLGNLVKKNRKSQIEENMNLEQTLRQGFGTSLKKSDLARKVLKKRKSLDKKRIQG